MSLTCCGEVSATGTGTEELDASHRTTMPGSSPVAQEQVTSLIVLEIQQQLMGASPCGNIIAPARVVVGSDWSRLKRPAFVSAQRVSPLESLICMLPERSIKKRTSPGTFCAV